MTVSATPRHVAYAGNGVTTAFTVPFRFLANEDLVVVRTDAALVRTPLVLNVDYSVAGAGVAAGGTLTATAAPAAGTVLSIAGGTQRVQPIDFTPGDPFPAEVQERGLDRLTMIAIEDADAIADIGSRAIQVPLGETAPVLARAALRTGGGKILAPNPTSGAIEVQAIDTAYRGPTGPANSTFASRATMAIAANPTNLSAIVDNDGLYTWVAGAAAAAFVATNPADYVASSYPGAAAGAWVRSPGEAGYASLAAIKGGLYVTGQVLRSRLYGGSTWVIQASVVLQNDDSAGALQSSVVNFDDELHQQVNLLGGGTGVAECQTGSIQGYIRQRYSELYAILFARLNQAASLASGMTLGCFGDSVTYGQAPTGYPGYIARIGTATNFGDGSTYAFDQLGASYPDVMTSLFGPIFGTGKVAVINRGYSGDRTGNAYRRQRVSFGQTCSLLGFGFNDDLYATNNGIDQTGLFISTAGYTFDRFIPSYRKFAYREVLRGSVPVFLTPYAFKSLLGYDGTNWAAAKLMALYRNAIHALADEMGAECVDGTDIVNAYANSDMTIDGIHPTTAGAYVLAARLVPMFLGNGWRDKTAAGGYRKTGVVKAVDNINGLISGVAEFPFIDNANTLGKPFATAAAGADINITTETRYFPIWCDEDETAVMPIGYLSGAGTMTVDIGLGAQVPKARLNTVRGSALGTFIAYPASKSVVSGGGTVIVNWPGTQGGGWPVCVGRGWHVVRVSCSNAFTMSGLFIGRFGDVAAAIADPAGGATVDTQARAALVSVMNVLRDRSLIAS